MTKRLFIFASYDPDAIVDDTLLHYLNALSPLGDIVFTMDNDISDDELAKVKSIPNVIHATATRHNEYDFGSYKRGYNWARDNKLLKKYDWVYLVNDSVYGPLWDLESTLIKLESQNYAMTGMVSHVSDTSPHYVQSWFIGLMPQIFTSDWFDEFLNSVCVQAKKSLIVYKYEVRMSQLIGQHGYTFYTLATDNIDGTTSCMYKKPIEMINRGVLFIKKQALSSTYILNQLFQYAIPTVTESIATSHVRTHGTIPNRIYKKVFELKLFSLPTCTIFKHVEMFSNTTSYKVKLFDLIPILKIIN